jgi:hypothetical protein
VAELDAKEKQAVKELARLTKTAGSSLDGLCGISTRSAAELLVEVGDPRRFVGEGGFARFNGTAPIPASSAEGDGEPVRYRLNRGGNRRVNAVLHIMAVTQLAHDERARRIFDDARHRGHSKKEAMRVVKRHLSDVVYRRMLADLEATPRDRPEHPGKAGGMTRFQQANNFSGVPLDIAASLRSQWRVSRDRALSAPINYSGTLGKVRSQSAIWENTIPQTRRYGALGQLRYGMLNG